MLHLQLSERDVERLLAGDQLHDRPELAEVAQFMAQLRALGRAESPPPMSPRLLARLDLAEAGSQSDKDGDEVRRRREDVRRRARVARRRWRLVGAAAMVAMLGGIVAAHAHGAFASRTPSHTTDAPPGADPPLADEPGTPSTPPTTTAPPQTDPTVTDPPPADTGGSDDSVVTSGDAPGFQDGRGDGYDGSGRGDGYDGRPFTPENYEKWVDECGQDWECYWRMWEETYGPGGPGTGGP